MVGHLPFAERAICWRHSVFAPTLLPCLAWGSGPSILEAQFPCQSCSPGALTLLLPRQIWVRLPALAPDPHGIPASSSIAPRLYFSSLFTCLSLCLYSPRPMLDRWLSPQVPHWSSLPLQQKAPSSGGLSGTACHVMPYISDPETQQKTCSEPENGQFWTFLKLNLICLIWHVWFRYV